MIALHVLSTLAAVGIIAFTVSLITMMLVEYRARIWAALTLQPIEENFRHVHAHSQEGQRSASDAAAHAMAASADARTHSSDAGAIAPGPASSPRELIACRATLTPCLDDRSPAGSQPTRGPVVEAGRSTNHMGWPQ